MSKPDINAYLQNFLELVKSYRQTGDEDDANYAAEYHARVHYWMNSNGTEPDWAKYKTTKEEFYSYTSSGRFTILMP